MDDFYNVKIKTYSTGKQVIIFCNQSIFSPEKDSADLPPEFDLFEDLDNDEDIGQANSESPPDLEDDLPKEPDPVNVKRSMIRAKERIFDIAFCNDWEYFVTITWDTLKVDSFNAQECMAKLNVWLNDCSKRYGLTYMIIPEYHESGRIHMHGLVNGALRMVDSGTRTVRGYDKPLRLSTIRAKGLMHRVQDIVYNIPQWHYGFSSSVKIRGDPGALATYVTKYLTKATSKIFGKYYWSSQGLCREPDITYDCEPCYNELDLEEFIVPNTPYKLKYFTNMVMRRD